MSTTFLTSINYRELEHVGEVNTLPSLVQPDQVLSIKEMLDRHVRGLPVAGSSVSMYYDDDDNLPYFPDIHTLDLSEIDELRDQLRKRVQTIKADEKRSADDAAKADHDRKVKEEADKLLAKRQTRARSDASQQEVRWPQESSDGDVDA